MPNPSRGDAISGYQPAFAAGAKSYLTNLKAQALSGVAPSAGVTYAITHGLSAVPTMVLVTPVLTKAQATAPTTGTTVAEAAASAATSEVFYVIANTDDVSYKAFVVL